MLVLIVGSGTREERELIERIKNNKQEAGANGLRAVHKKSEKREYRSIKTLPCLLDEDRKEIDTVMSSIVTRLFKPPRQPEYSHPEPSYQPRQVPDSRSMASYIKSRAEESKRDNNNYSNNELAAMLNPRWVGNVGEGDD